MLSWIIIFPLKLILSHHIQHRIEHSKMKINVYLSVDAFLKRGKTSLQQADKKLGH